MTQKQCYQSDNCLLSDTENTGPAKNTSRVVLRLLNLQTRIPFAGIKFIMQTQGIVPKTSSRLVTALPRHACHVNAAVFTTCKPASRANSQRLQVVAQAVEG
jgi:hypothetical protein